MDNSASQSPENSSENIPNARDVEMTQPRWPPNGTLTTSGNKKLCPLRLLFLVPNRSYFYENFTVKSGNFTKNPKPRITMVITNAFKTTLCTKIFKIEKLPW